MKIYSKGLLFSFAEIDHSSEQWSEYCREYCSYGYPAPELLHGDCVRVILFRGKMLGGFIVNDHPGRYRKLISKTDINTLSQFDHVAWLDQHNLTNGTAISIDCLWRRSNTGATGRLATLMLYLAIMNAAKQRERKILVRAPHSGFQKLYRSWDPVASFECQDIDGHKSEIFAFHFSSGYQAIFSVLRKLFSSKKSKSISASKSHNSQKNPPNSEAA